MYYNGVEIIDTIISQKLTHSFWREHGMVLFDKESLNTALLREYFMWTKDNRTIIYASSQLVYS